MFQRDFHANNTLITDGERERERQREVEKKKCDHRRAASIIITEWKCRECCSRFAAEMRLFRWELLLVLLGQLAGGSGSEKMLVMHSVVVRWGEICFEKLVSCFYCGFKVLKNFFEHK